MKRFQTLGRSLSKEQMKKIIGGSNEELAPVGCLHECDTSTNRGCEEGEVCRTTSCDGGEHRLCRKE